MEEKCYNRYVRIHFQTMKGKRARVVTNDSTRYFNSSNPDSRGRSSTKVCEKCWNKYNNARTRSRSSQDQTYAIAGPSGVQLHSSVYHDVDQQVRLREVLNGCIRVAALLCLWERNTAHPGAFPQREGKH